MPPMKGLNEAKQFERMPLYLDMIGLNELHEFGPEVTELTREMAGGFISRFAFFQNVFRPHEYELDQQE